MRVLGCDPGFASFGWALFDVSATREVLLDLGVIRTEPSARKSATLAAADHLRRIREIHRELCHIEEEHGTIDAVAAEAYSQPRNAGSAVKLGFGWGTLGAWADARRLPVAHASPQKIKQRATGIKSASKEQVEAAIRRQWPAAGAMLDALPRTVREHAADACGALLACLDADAILAGRRL